ncbi:hypothetical protein GCM10028819_05090 [Spirosoma humi]
MDASSWHDPKRSSANNELDNQFWYDWYNNRYHGYWYYGYEWYDRHHGYRYHGHHRNWHDGYYRYNIGYLPDAATDQLEPVDHEWNDY